METKNFINKKYTYAVVGASQDESKYGFKVLKDFKDAGFKVVPINPNAKQILGMKVYPTLAEYPENIDVAILVVPPEIAKKIVHQCMELNIKKIWMQPGSESEHAKQYCRERGAECVWKKCIMVERKK